MTTVGIDTCFSFRPPVPILHPKFYMVFKWLRAAAPHWRAANLVKCALLVIGARAITVEEQFDLEGNFGFSYYVVSE
jgi:hypothetical protein